MRPTITALLAVSAALLVGAVIALTVLPRSQGPIVRSTGQALVGGPFTMVDHMGQTVTQDDFEGKLLLIYFGFTYCPDVCPTRLLTVTKALDQMGRKAESVQPIFVTIDPERDTVAAMKDYVGHFHADFVGLTGSLEQVAAMAEVYRVAYYKVQDKDLSTYTMDHTDILYLMSRDNTYLTHFTSQDTPEQIASGIKKHL